jgi:pantetheine-phosphate adenylyltransferase
MTDGSMSGIVSKLRQERSLPPLETHVISVISHLEQAAPLVDADRIKEAKLSSTFIRGWLAEQPQGEGPAE